jgi:putative tricarboxylic transport membrane protein
LEDELRVTDFTLALMLFALAATLAIGASSFPPMPGQAFGARLFPNLIATGLVICGALLCLRTAKAKQLKIGWVQPEWWGQSGRIGNLFFLLGGIALYTLLVERVGFLITTFVLLATLMRRLGASWKSIAIAATLGTAVTYVLFAYWLRVPLPAGILTGIVR